LGAPKHNLTKKVKLPGLPPGSWVSQKRHVLLGDNITETATCLLGPNSMYLKGIIVAHRWSCLHTEPISKYINFTCDKDQG